MGVGTQPVGFALAVPLYNEEIARMSKKRERPVFGVGVFFCILFREDKNPIMYPVCSLYLNRLLLFLLLLLLLFALPPLKVRPWMLVS